MNGGPNITISTNDGANVVNMIGNFRTSNPGHNSNTNINSGDEEPQSMVHCRVCGSMIDTSNKKEQHVVKCEYCNEATPIKDPPPGQKYIRCPCNCLLICKSSAQRISCPRQSCHKIIVLYNPKAKDVNTNTNDNLPVPGMCRVNCGHCGETFLFNSLVNQLARCPHCEKKSSVGREFARARGLIFLFFALLSLVLAIVVTIVTNPQVTNGAKGWIALYSILYLAALYFILRSAYFLTMKNSMIIENQS